MIFFLIFFLGIIIGSFLNVCIYRLPKGESIASPWSYCPECKTSIKMYDKIPIISYMILQGKCRNCNSKISFRYVLVEFITGILFLLLYYKLKLSIDFIFKSVFISTLIVIAFIDIENKIIPNIITISFTIFFLFMSIGKYLLTKNSDYILDPLLGLLIGGGFLYIIACIWHGGMGGGDIKLAVLIGTVLGWKQTILILILSFMIGSVFGLALITFFNKSRKDMIPFGPFLSIGSIISIFWGKEIIYWYLNTLR